MADYAMHVGVLIALFGVLALGQSLLFGLGNLLFVTQGASFGIGAYAFALIVERGVSSIIALPIASAAAAIVVTPLAVPALRLRGDYLLVASLALCEVVRSVLNNTPTATGGAQGLMGIPQFQFGPWTAAGPADYLTIACGLLGLVAGGNILLMRSPFGRLLRAAGEGGELLTGEDAMRALAKPIRKARVTAVAVAAGTAGFAGGIYATYMSYLDPSQFSIWNSVLILEMVVFGGLGTIRGTLAGVTAFVAIPELLRFAELSSTVADPMRQVLFGILLLVILRYRPAGLFGRKDLAWLKA
jgi:branched-chain amino acid transport system permease protein